MHRLSGHLSLLTASSISQSSSFVRLMSLASSFSFSSDKLVKMFVKMFVLVSGSLETRWTMNAASGRAFHSS